MSTPYRFACFGLATVFLSTTAAAVRAADATPAALPPLPKAVASFGAVACDGYLYVYGGHAGRTHHYDTQSDLGTFQRLKLEDGKAWEELPSGPPARAEPRRAQREGVPCRRDAAQEQAGRAGRQLFSRRLHCFDPKLGKWTDLPALPAGRSSHDVVIVGNKLVVVGGWQMKGKYEKPVWHDTVEILDLAAKHLKWESAPQPFRRRALTATVVGSKVYVLGGLGAESKPTEVFDVATKKWSTAPCCPKRGGGRWRSRRRPRPLAGAWSSTPPLGQSIVSTKRAMDGKRSARPRRRASSPE